MFFSGIEKCYEKYPSDAPELFAVSEEFASSLHVAFDKLVKFVFSEERLCEKALNTPICGVGYLKIIVDERVVRLTIDVSARLRV